MAEENNLQSALFAQHNSIKAVKSIKENFDMKHHLNHVECAVGRTIKAPKQPNNRKKGA
jgi:hypothetical protein